MKVKVFESKLESIEFEVNEVLNLAIILSSFMGRCTDKKSVEYSYLVGVICRQLNLIRHELQSILNSEEEKNNNH